MRRGDANQCMVLSLAAALLGIPAIPKSEPARPIVRDAIEARLFARGWSGYDRPAYRNARTPQDFPSAGSEWAGDSAVRADISAPSAPARPPRVPGARVDGIWTLLNVYPTALYEHAAAYDPSRQRVYVLGGDPGPGSFASVWGLELEPRVRWRELHAGGLLPERRFRHSTIYDPVGDRVILFGGFSPGYTARNDCWELAVGDSLRWRPLAASGTPPSPRYDHTAIYDPVGQRMLVFGGQRDSIDVDPLYDDLWALSLDGTPAWTKVATSGSPPSPRLGHTAVYDPLGDRMIVCGGYDGAFLGDVWVLDLAGTPTWHELAPQGSMPPRAWHTATLDSAGPRLVVYGGRSEYDFLGGSWTLELHDGAAWQLVPLPGDGPGPRANHASVADPTGERIVLIGGGNETGLVGDAWVVTREGAATVLVTPLEREGQSATYDPSRNRILVFGGRDGTASYATFTNDLWTLDLAGDDGTWTRLVPEGTPPPARAFHTTSYDPVRDRLLIFGGESNSAGGGSAVLYDDVWELSLATPPAWRRLAPSGAPPTARSHHAALYDSVRDRLLVYGGTANRDDLWELSLSGEPAWTQLPPFPNSPRTRLARTVAYDPLRDRLLVVGGAPANSPQLSLLELAFAREPFDEWNPILSLGLYYGWTEQMAVYDPRRDRLLFFGKRSVAAPDAIGLSGPPAVTSLTTAGDAPPPARFDALVYDSQRERMIVLGSGQDSSPLGAWALSFPIPSSVHAGLVPLNRVADGIAPGRDTDPRGEALAIATPMPPGRMTKPSGTPGIGTFLHPDGSFDLEAARRSGYEGALANPGVRLRVDPRGGTPRFAAAAGDDSADAQWAAGLAFGSPPAGEVLAFAIYRGMLVVATRQYGVGQLSSWDGATWGSFLWVGSTANTWVNALTVFEGDLVAGAEKDPGYVGAGTGDVYRWNGSTWAHLGGVFNGRVTSLVTYGDWLMAGGTFGAGGGAPHVAVWGGGWAEDRWYPLPAVGSPRGGSGGPNGDVFALGVHAGQLVVAGSFTAVGNDNVGVLPARSIATWCCGTWATLGDDSGVNSWIQSLLVTPDGSLVVGGAFTHAGRPGAAIPASRVARWNGTGWSAVGEGVAFADRRAAFVRSLASLGEDLYAGGSFDRAASAVAPNVARWSDSGWESTGGAGPDRDVLALLPYAGRLFAGGAFASVGATATGSTAAWDGTRWAKVPRGVGFDGRVRAFTEFGGSLIGAGSFFHSGDNTAAASDVQGVARWTGEGWERLGNGLCCGVDALLPYCGRLVAAGTLYGSGSTRIAHVASWDGSAWSQLGSIDLGPGSVQAGYPRIQILAEYRGMLVAGGHFRWVNGARAWGVGRWDGATWSPLGTGAGNEPDSVGALLVHQDTLFAGASHGVFYLDGTQWRRRGDATRSYVQALAVHDGRLVAGGQFVYVGTRLVNGVMQWDGSAWQRMGSMGAEVHAFLHYGSDFVGAAQVDSLRQHGSGIARWDGAEWVALGSGISPPAWNSPPGWLSGAYALIAYQGDLWVGGQFERAGGKASSNVARWRANAAPQLEPASASELLDPQFLRVAANAPNPFNPITSIRFEIRSTQHVRVTVYDVAGRVVARLLDGLLPAGRHDVRWNGATVVGGPAASGVYLYEVATDHRRETRKMQLVK